MPVGSCRPIRSGSESEMGEDIGGLNGGTEERGREGVICAKTWDELFFEFDFDADKISRGPSL